MLALRFISATYSRALETLLWETLLDCRQVRWLLDVSLFYYIETNVGGSGGTAVEPIKSRHPSGPMTPDSKTGEQEPKKTKESRNTRIFPLQV